ncbi:MAG: isoprenylcysteine carboxylmethyltransferase family protein [Terriglobales bacterium]
MHFRQLEMIPWYGFIVYWLISAARLKQVKVEEARRGRILHILIMVAAVDFMFSGNFSVGPLNQRIIPIDLRILYTGIALTWAGIAFAIWARHTIGANWSGRVTVKVDHQLIQSGPYAFVRHPIYSGLLAANLGAALVIGRWRCLVAMVIFLAEMTRKASKEEGFMVTEFGERYQEYRLRTGFLVPRLGGSGGQGPTMGGSKDQQMSA